MLLYLLLGLSALGAGFLVWRHDMYQHEPWWALLGAAALGALLLPACGALEDLVIFAATGTPSSAWIAANAAVWEEAARSAAVAAVALLLPRVFDDPMDGITYGSVVGLGMSLCETVLRLGPAPDFGGSLEAVEIARLCSHVVLGGIAGFPFGMWRCGIRGARVAFALCAPGAALLHFLVDWTGLREAGRPEIGTGSTILVAAAVLAGALAYGGLAAQGSEWSRRRFAPCTPGTLLGWPLSLFTKPAEIPDWCPKPGDPPDEGPGGANPR